MPIKLEGNRGFAMMEMASTTVSNNIVENTLFSAVIPAGKMGDNKILKLELVCHLSTPALSIPGLTLRLKFGSTTLVIAQGLLSGSITDKPLLIEVKIANQSSNSQFVTVKVLNNSGGLLFAALSNAYVVTDTAWTVDTKVDQMLSVTAQFGALSANTSITTKLAELNLS